MENKVKKGKGKEERREEDEEEGISKEEIKKVIARIKDGKAAGIDEIPGEVWKYGGR